MMTRTTKSFYFILATLTFSSFRSFSQNNDTLKCWNKNDKLNWRDFQGKSSLEQNSLSAACASQILVSPLRVNGILTYKVRAIFYKRRSWTKDTSKYLLAHEQLHFDIAELYARKLRKAILEIQLKLSTPTPNDFKVPIEKLLPGKDQLEDEYDQGTIHGAFKEGQEEWSKKIQTELEQLKEYASSAEDCGNRISNSPKIDSLICWSSSEKLKWSDFRGSVPITNGKLSDGAACSSMPKPYPLRENDSTYIYKVKTLFYRYKSWAKAKDTSQYLLAHEQLHFDMSELYARKMRKAFKGLGNWTEATAKAYSAIKKKIYAEHIALQNDYDAKTAHGILKKVQQEWVNKIRAELQALKEFASTLEDCNGKL